MTGLRTTQPPCPKCGALVAIPDDAPKSRELEAQAEHERVCEGPMQYVCTNPACETCGGRLPRRVVTS